MPVRDGVTAAAEGVPAPSASGQPLGGVGAVAATGSVAAADPATPTPTGTAATAAADGVVDSDTAAGRAVRSGRLVPGPATEPPSSADFVVVSGWRDTFAAWCGRIVLLAGLVSLVSLAFHGVRWADRVDDLFTLVNLPAAASLFSAVLLLVVGGAARRRMRVAWWALLVFQLVAVGYLGATGIRATVDPDFAAQVRTFQGRGLAVNALLTVVVIALLLASRPAFACRLAPGARWRSLTVLVVGIAASVTTSILLTLAMPGHLTGDSRRIQWAVRVAFGVRPDRTDVGWLGQYGHHWIDVVGGSISAASVIAAAVLFVRSAKAKAYLGATDELAIRGLLARHGERDSLGYFATRSDKSVIFSPSRDAAVTYRVLAEVSLASADPIGAPQAWPAAVHAWVGESRRRGWFPAVISASEDGARAYAAAGLKVRPLGDEAVVDTEAFTLAGPEMAPLRRSVRRIRRAGYTITVHRHAELSATQLAELADAARRFRAGESERGFSMALGRLGEPGDGRCVAVGARDDRGRLCGVLSFVPWGRHGLSLDLMRHDPTADNGLTEAMVAELIRVGREDLGVRRVSLNFAMLRGVFEAAERVDAHWPSRLAGRVLRAASRFWQIESLYRSNARYRPQWVPRYLCYDSGLTLTRVALAAAGAEGFLPFGGRPGPPRDPATLVAVGGRALPFGAALAAQEQAGEQQKLPAHVGERYRCRARKLELLAAAGREAYPVRVPRDGDVAQVRARFGALAAGTRTGVTVSVAGRVVAWRDFGGLVFAVLQDAGARIQALATRAGLGDGEQRLLRAAVGVGDFLSVTGEVVASAAGELTVDVASWELAAKSLGRVGRARPATAPRRPTPDARHLDLVHDPAAVRLLAVRGQVLGAVRGRLAERGFLEVETPMLQAVHGGAQARPFVTRLNALDRQMYLRIAPELHLKRLCVGGLGKIYELNRSFRNEGVDDSHNPEFTSLEVYQAYSDYLGMRDLVRELILHVATAVHGAPVARRSGAGPADEVDLSGPWPFVDVYEAVSAACGEPVTPETDRAELAALCTRHRIRVPGGAGPATLFDKLYGRLVEAATVLPTFYADFAVDTSPLARPHRSKRGRVERWDLVAFGTEIGTAYSELVDPVDQRARLAAQSLARAAGDPEAMELDEPFLAALACGMPPTGGLGLGIDRLIMLLTGRPIRETLAFPLTPGSRPPAG